MHARDNGSLTTFPRVMLISALILYQLHFLWIGVSYLVMTTAFLLWCNIQTLIIEIYKSKIIKSALQLDRIMHIFTRVYPETRVMCTHTQVNSHSSISYMTGREYLGEWNWYLTSKISQFTWSRHNCLVIGTSSAIDCDVISRTKTKRVRHGDDCVIV